MSPVLRSSGRCFGQSDEARQVGRPPSAADCCSWALQVRDRHSRRGADARHADADRSADQIVSYEARMIGDHRPAKRTRSRGVSATDRVDDRSLDMQMEGVPDPEGSTAGEIGDVERVFTPAKVANGASGNACRNTATRRSEGHGARSLCGQPGSVPACGTTDSGPPMMPSRHLVACMLVAVVDCAAPRPHRRWPCRKGRRRPRSPSRPNGEAASPSRATRPGRWRLPPCATSRSSAASKAGGVLY